MEQKQPIDIVMTTWGREWMTKLSIQAIKKNTWGTPFRLIIIDNGSTFTAQELYLTSSDIYIKLDHNYGLEHAKNLGMKFVQSEYFVSTDNDILPYNYPDKDWLAQLLELMDKEASLAALALRPQVLVGTNTKMFEVPDAVVPFSHVPGYCRLMRTCYVNMVGAWKDKRPLRGHEEIWIGSKLAEYNLHMGWANHVKCWHLFGSEDTDMWGYPKGMKPEEHGHNPVWPIYKNDRDLILKEVGVDVYGI